MNIDNNVLEAAIRNRFLLNADLEASPEWFLGGDFSANLDCDVYYPFTKVTDGCVGVSDDGKTNLYYEPGELPKTLDAFKATNMNDDCTPTWAKKDNTFNTNAFVSEYNNFWPEY